METICTKLNALRSNTALVKKFLFNVGARDVAAISFSYASQCTGIAACYSRLIFCGKGRAGVMVNGMCDKICTVLVQLETLQIITLPSFRSTAETSVRHSLPFVPASS